METQHDILVQNKREIQFKITIRRKITVIRDDSATGKSTLFQMVSDANTSSRTGVNIACDVPVVALYETGYQYELNNESGKIYVIDEDFSHLKTKEFASLVLKSDNCFIIITRESLPAINTKPLKIKSGTHRGSFLCYLESFILNYALNDRVKLKRYNGNRFVRTVR